LTLHDVSRSITVYSLGTKLFGRARIAQVLKGQAEFTSGRPTGKSRLRTKLHLVLWVTGMRSILDSTPRVASEWLGQRSLHVCRHLMVMCMQASYDLALRHLFVRAVRTELTAHLRREPDSLISVALRCAFDGADASAFARSADLSERSLRVYCQRRELPPRRSCSHGLSSPA
jgi:hypothetical protein